MAKAPAKFSPIFMVTVNALSGAGFWWMYTRVRTRATTSEPADKSEKKIDENQTVKEGC
jgi:hypothetical protein